MFKTIQTKLRNPFPAGWFFKAVWLDWFVLAVYTALGVVMVLRHEPWSDEAQPWLLARDLDLPQLLGALFKNYDRHPCLWYLVLSGLNKLGLPYISMAAANLAFVLAAAALILFKAPFPRWFKYPLLFSYHLVYEYPAIARSYGLTMLLLFTTVWLFDKRLRHPLLYGTAVFLLFNCEYITLGFPAALTVLFALEILKKKDWNGSQSLALLLMIAGGILVFLQGANIPPDHIDYGKGPVYIPEWHFLSRSFFPFVYYVPESVSYAAGAVIIVFAFWMLRARPQLLFVLLSSFGMLFFIFKFRHMGDLRHFGFVPLILLAVTWLEDSFRKEHSTGITAMRSKEQTGLLAALTLCFLLSMPYSYFAWKLDYHAVFSGGKHMSEMIRLVYQNFNLEKSQYVIATHKHVTTASVLPYLPGHRFWIPAKKDFATYYLNTMDLKADDEMGYAEALQRIEEAFPDMTKVFVMLDTKLFVPDTEKYHYNLMIDMTPYFVFGYRYEKFYMYRATPKKQIS